MLKLVKKMKKAIIMNTNRSRAMGVTKEGGVVQFLMYRDKDDSMYTAVCLTFDIVEHGNDPDELKESIEEAARLHFASVVKNDLDDKLLNRSAPQEYWKILFEGMVETENQKENKQEVPAVSDIWNRSKKELVTA